MKHIEQTLTSLFQKSNDNQFWKINLLQNWPKIVGNIANKVMIYKIHKDTITLGVFELCWMQELYTLSPMLLKKINNFLGENQIKSVRFRAAHKEETVKVKKTETKEFKKELSAKELASIKSIKDPDLAKSLQTLLEKCR